MSYETGGSRWDCHPASKSNCNTLVINGGYMPETGWSHNPSENVWYVLFTEMFMESLLYKYVCYRIIYEGKKLKTTNLPNNGSWNKL